MKKILVIAAHPDDEILGSGGTLAGLSKDYEVYVLILVTSITSRNIILGKSDCEYSIQNALEAHKILGIKESFFENFPDNSFDKLVFLEIVQKIEFYVDKIKPDIVFTHHHSDLNLDHRITFQAVITCCRPQPNFKHPDIYCFEIPSSTEWQYYSGETVFKPNIFIDITKTIDLKLNALEKYKTEMREYPHSRSIEGIKLMAQDWGRKVGKKYVEAFELIRSIRESI